MFFGRAFELPDGTIVLPCFRCGMPLWPGVIHVHIEDVRIVSEGPEEEKEKEKQKRPPTTIERPDEEHLGNDWEQWERELDHP